MSSPRDTPFTKTNSKSIYGKTPLESWVGTVVAYDSQKEQIEGGWGWRYKVRIMGDNTNTDQITDQQLSYAYVLLPTTAGSGGAYKMRSVRISQGDFVYGVRGGGAGAPTMILGVFPRTASQGSGDGNFKNLSGFYGSLGSPNKTLSGEFNEQKGPNTPGVTALDPKEQNLSNRPDPSPLLETVGVDPKDDKTIDNLEKNGDGSGKLDPKRKPENTAWKEGDPINKDQVLFILKNWDKKNHDEFYIRAMINAAFAQNIFTGASLNDTAVRKVTDGGSGLDIIEILFTPKIPIVSS